MKSQSSAPNVSRTVFAPSPRDGTMIMSSSYYTRKEGTALLRVDQEIYRSDSVDSVQLFVSEDNGETWTQTDKIQTTVPEGTGTRQLAFRSGVNDPNTDRFIHIYNSAYWPNDHPLDGLRRRQPHYKISEDGG
ncbi:MAG: exo-alpha-sialidase, partial [Opitutaceae bacterium]|nr:exo-alpha-sialidase [Opitutaceae bacterium]